MTSVPRYHFTESFVRASGPGGQNVNKVSTAVELRFDIAASPFPTEVKGRLRSLAGARLTTNDELVIEAREHRTQSQNRAAARERLDDIIQRAFVRPKRRTKTRPTAASKTRRLDEKQRRARLKQRRGRAGDQE